MRVALPPLRPNGHAPQPGEVYAITGMCQDPRFRLRFQTADPEDFCLIYLGAAAFGAQPAPGAELAESAGDPYVVLRRWFDQRQAAAVLRLDWEGIFTLLANDDDCAAQLYRDMVEPAAPEDVNQGWTQDAASLRMFSDLLILA